ncbi:hypothetical protein BX600DRAFT_471608 [Xylariales sp. PMI_506]|nr:hypothetical protein BX600DRAFT_471608 [Xylariales sp. PMI_506]
MSDVKIPTSTPLCLLAAYEAYERREISEQEYRFQALSHLAGVVHDEDVSEDHRLLHTLGVSDLFLYTTRDVSKEIKPINDAGMFKKIIAIFEAYRAANLAEIERLHNSLEPYLAPHIRRILASSALNDNKAGVLKFCLDLGGFKYDSPFITEAKFKGSPNLEFHPDIRAAMEGTEFRRLHPWTPHPSEAFQDNVDW